MFVVWKIVGVMTPIVLQNIISHADIFAFSKSHMNNVNHEILEIHHGVGISSTFLAVMQCFY